MDDIVNFRPLSELSITAARILLIGPVGAGKSSFCNMVNSIYRGRITQRAGSGSAMQSLTTKFNPVAPITSDTTGFISKPTLDDKVHYVVFVVDGTTLAVLSEKILQKIKISRQSYIKKIYHKLTKVDRVCKAVAADISVVFRSTTIEKHVDKAIEIFGLPRANILPVKNYENEIQLDESTSILALLSMRQILNFAEDHIENLQDKMRVRQRDKPDMCQKESGFNEKNQ